jgi:microcystin-dependent protein
MASPFLGQLSVFAFNFPPKGWALCNGQTLSIQQNPALFSLLGTSYGGNGVQTFALPNLQGRVPTHFGNVSPFTTPGVVAGEEAHTLLTQEMPAHNHQVNGVGATATIDVPKANMLAAPGSGFPYVPISSIGSTVNLNPAALVQAGASQPHENRQPYLVVNICIATSGIFPSRN